MASRSPWDSCARGVVAALALLATRATAGEPPAVEPHPLVVAVETLYQRKLPKSCDEVVKLASIAPGLTDEDVVRLQFVAAMRELDEHNEVGARRAISQALQVDPTARRQSFAPPQFVRVLEDVRARLPPRPVRTNEAERLAAAKKAAGEREPGPKASLRAVDALYSALDIEGAEVVLSLARGATPMTEEDRAQVEVRQGMLRMESADEDGARKSFRAALNADRTTNLPAYAPPKTVRAFEEEKKALPARPVTMEPAVKPTAGPGALPPPAIAIELHAAWSDERAIGSLFTPPDVATSHSGQAFHASADIPLTEHLGLNLGTGYITRGAGVVLPPQPPYYVGTAVIDEQISYLRLLLGVRAHMPFKNELGSLRLRLIAGLSPELAVDRRGTFLRYPNNSFEPLTNCCLDPSTGARYSYYSSHKNGNVAAFLAGSIEAGLGSRPQLMIGLEAMFDIHMLDDWGSQIFNGALYNDKYYNINIGGYVKYVFQSPAG